MVKGSLLTPNNTIGQEIIQNMPIASPVYILYIYIHNIMSLTCFCNLT